jgi:hypothetical protein
MEKTDIALIAIILLSSFLLVLFFGIKFTGYHQQIGSANVTVVSKASINFTLDNVNWGVGAVDAGEINAHLDTEGNILDGNWTNVYQGLVLRNEGNCNVTVNLSTDTAATFLGGSAGGGPSYKLKISDNETGSCATGYNEMSTYTETSGSAQDACLNFSYEDSRDQLNIDINITIPRDVVPGEKGTLITAYAGVV